MFTGIIEETGTVTQVDAKKNLAVLKIRAKSVLKGMKKGDSLLVEGVCLTATNILKGIVTFDVMRETMLKTTLGKLKAKSKVNLELALKASGRFNGHFVTGHIDDVGIVRKRITQKNNIELQISVPQKFLKYIVPKGSICLDGISLTVGQVQKNYFSVYIIPFTDKNTTLGFKKKGDCVNIETDLLAKYILNHG